MRTTARRAFSLVELMTVVGIIALLISLLLPALSRARETAKRTVCLANLRSMAHGCIAYAVNNDQHFPAWGQQVSGFASIGEAWNWSAGSPLNVPAYSPVSNTRNLWMLVRGQAGDPKTFICPSDSDAGDPFQPGDITNVYDVQNRSQFSYSFQYQGPAQTIGSATLGDTRTGWNTSLRDDSKLVIAADATPNLKARNPTNTDFVIASTNQHQFYILTSDNKPDSTALQTFVNGMTNMAANAAPPLIRFNWATAKGEFQIPGQETVAEINSANHRGEGQNIVRLDGSGEFSAHPWAGAYLDNIYTVQDPSAYDTAHLTAPLDKADEQNHTDMLRARMLGLYETYTAVIPAGQFAYTENGIMQAWVSSNVSKTRFPDSFLVP